MLPRAESAPRARPRRAPCPSPSGPRSTQRPPPPRGATAPRPWGVLGVVRHLALADGRVARDDAKNDVAERLAPRRTGVDRVPDARRGEERLHLGCKQHPVPVRVIEERLLAGTIARQDQAALRLIPDREAEHPIQPLDALGSVLLVEMHDRLGIRLRPEGVAARQQVRAQAEVVVNLPVEGDVNRAVLVRHRLVGHRAEVDDLQPAEPESRLRLSRDV